MTGSRETLEHWLDVADQLEKQQQSASEPEPDSAVAGEVWIPRSPDPFGHDWKWLQAQVDPGELRVIADGVRAEDASAVVRPSRATPVASPPAETPRSADRSTSSPRRVRISHALMALAAALLIGVGLGQWGILDNPWASNGVIAVASLDLQLSPPTVRGPGDPSERIASCRAPFDGFLCAAVLSDGDSELSVIPDIDAEADIATRRDADVSVALPAGAKLAAIVITEQPAHLELFRALNKGASSEYTPRQLENRIVQELQARHFRRVAVTVTAPSTDR